MKIKVAIYARVSTYDKGQDPETQLMPMRRYCEKSGWDYEEFVDHASGFDGKRLALTEMMTMLKRKEFDAVVVWKLDRLGRSLKNLIDIIYGELRPRGVGFVSITETIDTTTPAGQLIFNVLGAMAQFEHDIIAERVKAGMARARAQGIPIGRRRTKFNFQSLLGAYQRHRTVAAAAREVGLNPGTAWGYLKEAGVLGKF